MSEPGDLTRRRKYRRRRIVVFSTLALLLSGALYVTNALVAPVPATAAVAERSITIAQQTAQLAWPNAGGSAVTVIGYPGIAAAQGTTASVPIASMTKTITALVILDKKPIAAGTEGASIKLTAADVNILSQVVSLGGSWAPVVAGTTLTEKQALEAMLVPSANNYAISLANWAYGSMPAYLTAADAWLAKHRLTGTRVADASGFNPQSMSTTTDLIEIGKMVLAEPTLASIVSTAQDTLPSAGTIKNTNALLGTDGVDGIKTGSTSQAGYCLMFSAKITVGTQPITVLGAVVGAPTMDALFASVSALIASVKNGFHEVDVTQPGQVFGTYTTKWGATSKLVAKSTTTMLVWSDTPITSSVVTQPVQLGKAGDTVGSVTFTLGTKTVSTPLTLKTTLKDPGFWWRVAHPGG
ncbi:MAG TPA: D-alanyl-D-alanine carboxypeptidase [Microbacteriaceae bacterium]|nr:D-alanyl-D-alanine carboxypeptidase [Microbacteriaceae bacterium]